MKDMGGNEEFRQIGELGDLFLQLENKNLLVQTKITDKKTVAAFAQYLSAMAYARTQLEIVINTTHDANFGGGA